MIITKDKTFVLHAMGASASIVSLSFTVEHLLHWFCASVINGVNKIKLLFAKNYALASLISYDPNTQLFTITICIKR